MKLFWSYSLFFFILLGCGGDSVETFFISGTVSGLSAGKQVTLLNNSGNATTVNANGSFTFSTPIVYNSSYAVTVGTQPVGQTCTVTNNSGSGVVADVSNVTVSCNSVFSFTGSNFVYTPSLTGIVTANTARIYNLWIKIPAPLTTYSTLIGQGTLQAYNRSAVLIDLASRTNYSNGTGRYFLHFDIQTQSVQSSRFEINDTAWHMVTVTFNTADTGFGVKFYFDGSLLTNPLSLNNFDKTAVNTINFNSSITFGGETYNGTTLSPQTGFTGDIQKVNAWSRALNATEIQNLYNFGTLPSSGLFFSK